MLLLGHYYDRCVACSARVVKEFRANPFALTKRAMLEPTYLEELAGLHELAGNNDDDDQLEQAESWADGNDDDFDFDDF